VEFPGPTKVRSGSGAIIKARREREGSAPPLLSPRFLFPHRLRGTKSVEGRAEDSFSPLVGGGDANRGRFELLIT